MQILLRFQERVPEFRVVACRPDPLKMPRRLQNCNVDGFLLRMAQIPGFLRETRKWLKLKNLEASARNHRASFPQELVVANGSRPPYKNDLKSKYQPCIHCHLVSSWSKLAAKLMALVEFRLPQLLVGRNYIA